MTWRSRGRHGQRLGRNWLRASALASVLLTATLFGGTAAGQPVKVALSLDRCEPEQLDPTELTSLLQIELASIMSRQVLVSQVSAASLAEPAALQLDIRCPQSGGSPLLIVASQPLGTSVRTQVPLSDVLPAERTRTLAMAIAEYLRPRYAKEAAPAISSAPLVAAFPAPPRGGRERLRRSTVALISVSGVALAAGVVLGSLTWSSLVHGSGGDIVGGIGYGALGVSGLSLLALGINLSRNTH